MTVDIQKKNKVTVLHSIPIWLRITETWQFNQINSLSDEIESHVVCESTENLSHFKLPNIHSLKEKRPWLYQINKNLLNLGFRRNKSLLIDTAKCYGAKILHSHFGIIGWEDLKAVGKLGIKHVTSFYGLDVSYLPKQNPHWYDRYKVLFERVDSILCEGRHMAKCIMDLGCSKEKIRVHHLGVNVASIPFIPREWDATSPLRILIAATFREKKGIPYALEALGVLQHDVPIEITIIGGAGTDPRSRTEGNKINPVIEKHNLSSKIRMLGFQPHERFFEEAYRHHIFLSPSITAEDGDTEGGVPIGIIETAASGMPVVSTFHCDIPEVIHDNVSGFLAAEKDIDALIDHLLWLARNPDSWKTIVTKARNHIEKEYDSVEQGKRLASIYKELLR